MANTKNELLKTLQLPQECIEVSFAQLPVPKEKSMIARQTGEIMQTSAILKTATLTIELSNDISDSLLSRILLEVSHA